MTPSPEVQLTNIIGSEYKNDGVYIGPNIETVGIDSGIVSSQFDHKTSVKFELPEMDALVQPNVICFAEIQKKYDDPTKFLAVIEIMGEKGKKYMRWITNDESYAKSHYNIFDMNVYTVENMVVGILVKDEKGNPIR